MKDSTAQGDYSYTSAATNSFTLVGHTVSGADYTVPSAAAPALPFPATLPTSPSRTGTVPAESLRARV